MEMNRVLNNITCLPSPTIKLEYGKDISEENLYKLKNEDVIALLYDKNNKPHKIILWVQLLGFREQLWEDFLKIYPNATEP